MALLLPRRKAGAVNIADVFSTDTYSGASNTATSITNGVDLSTEGGLVWFKCRSNAINHYLFDTERGVTSDLKSNSTAAQDTAGVRIQSFNSDGYTHASSPTNLSLDINETGRTFVSWTFRKSPSFFDVVTYTGNGTAGRTISHNLGVTPGMIVVKETDSAFDWRVFHRSVGATKWLEINTTSAEQTATQIWNDTDPTDTVFTVGINNGVNSSSKNYVAYLFAHDTTDNGVIQCGSYTGNGLTTGPTVTLGWEPQWVMIKRATGGTGSWYIWDSARDGTNPRSAFLYPNQSAAEGTGVDMDFTSTGFQIKDSGTEVNPSGSTVVYVAIRKEGV